MSRRRKKHRINSNIEETKHKAGKTFIFYFIGIYSQEQDVRIYRPGN